MWPVIDGFPLNHLLVGWLAGNGLVLVLVLVVVWCAEQWHRLRARRRIRRQVAELIATTQWPTWAEKDQEGGRP